MNLLWGSAATVTAVAQILCDTALPQNYPRHQRKLLMYLKWQFFFWFDLLSRPCGVPDTSSVTQEVQCLFGIHTIYLPFSHCVSPWQPAEWARKRLWNHRRLDRGVLPARKRLAERRSAQFYVMKEALRGYTPCWWYVQDQSLSWLIFSFSISQFYSSPSL